jgi:hypothetical protein
LIDYNGFVIDIVSIFFHIIRIKKQLTNFLNNLANKLLQDKAKVFSKKSGKSTLPDTREGKLLFSYFV